MYSQCVAVGGGGACGVLSRVADHFLQEFNTLFLTRFRTYKIATSPQPKKTPVKTTFRDWCLYSFFVHAPGVEGWGILGCKWNCVSHERAFLKKRSSKTTCPVPLLWFSLVRILRLSSLKNSFVCLSSPTIYIFIFYPPRSHRGHTFMLRAVYWE